jgi:hypothetical protein
MWRLAVFLVLAIQLVGCANPNADFYQSYAIGQPIISYDEYAPCDGPVQTIASPNFKQYFQELLRRGYAPVGQSSFEGAEKVISIADFIRRAQDVGACIVLVTSQASYGQKSMMMSYSIQRYNTRAIYFTKVKLRFGAGIAPASSLLEQEIGHKGGLVITAIVRGGAAYQADILEGDVIMAVDGTRLNGADNVALFQSITRKKSGQTVQVEIWRKGVILSKAVQLASN